MRMKAKKVQNKHKSRGVRGKKTPHQILQHKVNNITSGPITSPDYEGFSIQNMSEAISPEAKDELKKTWGPALKTHNDGTVSIDVSKETMDDIMSKDEPIIKKASDITDEDRLKFELGKLRTYLNVFKVYVEHEGNLYLVQVDPLNRMVKFLSGSENK